MKLDNLKNKRVLVVGDLIVDTYHTGSVSRISPEAPIPVVRVTKSFSVLGGAANVARNLKALHSQPVVIGMRGMDANGELMERLFGENGIECHLICSDYPTITKTRIVGNRQQIVRVDFENEKMKLPTKVYQQVFSNIDKLLPDMDAVVLSDYGKGFCNDILCRYLINKACEYKKIVIIDPKGNDWYKYSRATFITPNVKELSDVAGEKLDNTDEKIITIGMKMKRQYKIDNVLVTRSEKGMTLINNDGTYNLPTVAREVFDVSGAGDTVVATLAASLAGGFCLEDSLSLANQAAGIVVGKSGTQPILLEELTVSNTSQGDNKLITLERLKDLLLLQRKIHRKIVFTNGCFDVIHLGHVTYLQKARRLGDLLIIGLNSDSSVRKLKGEGRPINNEIARAKVLAALTCVDYIILFEEDTPYELIKNICPDILVKGGDYKIEDVIGREYAKEVMLIDFVDGYSSTSIIKKMP